MSTKVPSAGEHALSRCSKCKETTNHTIVAMVGSQIARVECNVCGSVHNHRGTSVPKSGSTSVRSPAQPRKTRAQHQWQNLMAAANTKAAIPYNVKTPVKTGDLIAHPTFGTGQIIATVRPNKMDVMFESGVKRLICTPTN